MNHNRAITLGDQPVPPCTPTRKQRRGSLFRIALDGQPRFLRGKYKGLAFKEVPKSYLTFILKTQNLDKERQKILKTFIAKS